MTFKNASLFPKTVEVNDKGHLVLGGCDVTDLVSEFGTPLYVFDEHTLRSMCTEFVSEFQTRYPTSLIAYAAKAFINPTLATIINEHGLGMDIVSGGELAVAQTVQFPPSNIYFHGNNKTNHELQMALDYKTGRIVVDGFNELNDLNRMAKSRGVVQDIMLRISPSVDPHTHAYTTTGVLDSKFGFPIETGDATQAIKSSIKASNLNLVGLHFHLGSPIFELEPYSTAINAVLTFASHFKNDGLDVQEFSPGGGFAIGYDTSQPPPSIADYAQVITSAVITGCNNLGLNKPKLVVEPGRSIVGRAGVALYTVGTIKNIPGVRKYVSLDGGMGDNIRPALYQAQYDAVIANKMSEPPEETITLAGKFCESGDILVRDISLPNATQGDIIAIPSSGAYAPSMANNYNMNPKPALIMVMDGKPKLIRRRETYADLMLADIY